MATNSTKYIANPATLFHLVPDDDTMNDMLKARQNEKFLSFSRKGSLGFEVGFHVAKQPFQTDIAKLGQRGDLILRGKQIRALHCVFGYKPDSKCIFLHPLISPADEMHLDIYYEHSDVNEEEPYLANFRVLNYGKSYMIRFGADGPKLQVVWVQNGNSTELCDFAHSQFELAQKRQGITPEMTAEANTATNVAIVNRIREGRLPLIDNAMPIKEIGRGAFGKVWHAVELEFGMPVAVKICRIPKKEKGKQYLDREIDVLIKARHPNVIEFLGRLDKPNKVSIITPLRDMNLTALAEKAEGALRVDLCELFNVQILKGLDYIHCLGLIHRDLKPDNILCQQLSGQQWLFQLADFGCVNRVSMAETLCGSPMYMAPEVLRSGWHTTKMDIYSLYVTHLELLTPLLGLKWDLESLEAIHETVQIAGRRQMIQPLLPMGDADANRRSSAADLLKVAVASWRQVRNVLSAGCSMMDVSTVVGRRHKDRHRKVTGANVTPSQLSRKESLRARHPRHAKPWAAPTLQEIGQVARRVTKSRKHDGRFKPQFYAAKKENFRIGKRTPAPRREPHRASTPQPVSKKQEVAIHHMEQIDDSASEDGIRSRMPGAFPSC